jgi:hypothetical protein
MRRLFVGLLLRSALVRKKQPGAWATITDCATKYTASWQHELAAKTLRHYHLLLDRLHRVYAGYAKTFRLLLELMLEIGLRVGGCGPLRSCRTHQSRTHFTY